MSLEIEILIDSSVDLSTNLDAIKRSATLAARLAAQWRGFSSGEIGIRLTDDATIHEINRKHLGHDYPTDVISFGYQAVTPRIEGELIASVDTARRRASEIGWDADHELLLYIVHGVLHLTGMDDHAPSDRSEMRTAEAEIMMQLGIPAIVKYGADIAHETETDQNTIAEKQS